MLTEDQRKGRMKGLGSSDMPAIFGEDPFRSSWDVWAEKTGLVKGFEGNDATRRGNYLEAGILDFAEETLQQPIERNVTLLDPDGGPLAANLDGLCRAMDANIEAKSVAGEIDPDEWGPEWTDIIPNRVIIQTHVAMICGKLSISYIPVVLPVFKRFEFRMYVVKFIPELAAEIRRRAAHFWNEHVLKNIPPEDVIGSLEVLKKIRRESGVTATVEDSLVVDWEAAKADERAAKDRKEAAEAGILSTMEPINADAAVTTTGRKLTYNEVASTRIETYDRKAYRVLRLAGAKKSKRAPVGADA